VEDKYMQENNNNTKKIIIISVVAVILLSVFAYVLLSKGSAPATNNTNNTTQNNPVFPDFSFANIFGGVGEETSNNTEINTTNLTASNVFKVWEGETLGASTLDDASVIFIDKKTGEIRVSAYPYTSSSVVDTISGGCFDAKISSTGKKALISCPDGLYIWGDSRFTFIDQTAFDFDFIGGGNDYVYLSANTNGFVLVQNKAGKTSILGGLSLRDVTILKSDEGYVYITEKPNGRSEKLFVYSFKNKDFYFVGDLATQNISPFQRNYSKEKCFTYDTDFNFCFGIDLENFNFTNWRKGLISSVDQAFAYSFTDAEYVGVGLLSQNIDTLKTGYNATSGDAYLIDKNTSDLFVVNMAQFVEATGDHDH
jgi:hypothetical protein